MPEQKSGEIFTFYSYKGGVGRSMAVANVATLLAQQGKRVLVIDFDLEAPGLHRYFLATDTELSEAGIKLGEARFQPPGKQWGVIELFTELRDRLKSLFPQGGPDLMDGPSRSAVEQIVAALLDAEQFRYEITVNNPNVKQGTARLSFLPAARFDEAYSERVRSFDWQEFYAEFADVFPLLAAALRDRYDYVLIDSRTGLTDTGSICTVLLPDKLVLAFSPNRQSLQGVLEVGRQALRQRKALPDLPDLPVFPLLSRLEDGEQALKQKWIDLARTQFESLYREMYGQECDLSPYFKLVRIRHDVFYSYGEWIAAERESSTETGSMAQAFDAMGRCLMYQSTIDAQRAEEWLAKAEIDFKEAFDILEINHTNSKIFTFLKGKLLSMRGHPETSLSIYETLLKNHGSMEIEDLHLILLGKAEDLVALARHEEALITVLQVIRQNKEITNSEMAKTLLVAAQNLYQHIIGSLGWSAERVKAYEDSLQKGSQ